MFFKVREVSRILVGCGIWVGFLSLGTRFWEPPGSTLGAWGSIWGALGVDFGAPGVDFGGHGVDRGGLGLTFGGLGAKGHSPAKEWHPSESKNNEIPLVFKGFSRVEGSGITEN